jgi:hypothetical protein
VSAEAKNGATIRALRKRIRALEQERQHYIKVLQKVYPPEDPPPMTEKEFLELQKHAIPFEKVMREVNKVLKG